MAKVELLFRFAKIKLKAWAASLENKYMGKEPDYSQAIKQRCRLIESNIKRSKTAWNIKVCEDLIKVWLFLPYGHVAQIEIQRLYTMLWNKDSEIRRASNSADERAYRIIEGEQIISSAFKPTV